MIWCWDTLSHFYFSTAILRDIGDIMWVTLCWWMNFKVFIYHAISFLFSHHYLFLTERVGNMIFARFVAIWHCRSLISDIFLSLCSKSILVCMDSNHVQNQSKVSAYPAEELRIQPVKWWSPWEGLLINKGVLLPNAPHHRMTVHSQ